MGVGWSPKFFLENAESIENSETIAFLSKIAKRYNCNIIGGSFVEKKADGNCYNTSPVINRCGQLVTSYSKNHLYSYECIEKDILQAGSEPVMVDIEGIKVGLSICFDIRFAEIYRAYRKAGADLFVNVAAWGANKPLVWECLTRTRAIENQTFMIALTQSGYIEGDEYNIGHSRIIDFMGETVEEIKEQEEGLMTAEVEFSLMYEYRNKFKILEDIKTDYEVKII